MHFQDTLVDLLVEGMSFSRLKTLMFSLPLEVRAGWILQL